MSKPIPSFPVSPDSVTLEEILHTYQKRCRETKTYALPQEKKLLFALFFLLGIVFLVEFFSSQILLTLFPTDIWPFLETINDQHFLPKNKEFLADGKMVSINAYGFRGNPPSQRPEVKKILFLGDSLTFGAGISNEETYPILLKDHFENSETFNGACPGASLKQWKSFAPLISAIQPDLVINCLGGEDLIQLSLQKDFSQIPSHSLFYHSALLRLLLAFKIKQLESTPKGRKRELILFQERAPTPYHMNLIAQSFSAHLESLIEFSKEKNFSLVLCEVPHFFQHLPKEEDPEIIKISRLARKSVWSLKNWQEMTTTLNETIRTIGEQEKISVIQFSSETFDSKDFRDFRHLTAEGHQKMMKEIFQQLRPQKELFLRKKKE
ncbi:MAG: GDSL-type esterase/lipase family protein [Planctomycetota bacterium]